MVQARLGDRLAEMFNGGIIGHAQLMAGRKWQEIYNQACNIGLGAEEKLEQIASVIGEEAAEAFDDVFGFGVSVRELSATEPDHEYMTWLLCDRLLTLALLFDAQAELIAHR